MKYIHYNNFEEKKQLEIDDLLNNNNGDLTTIKGAVHKIRKLSNISFVVLRTNRDIIQCISLENNNSLITDLKEGDFIEVEGTVVKNVEAYKGIEININSIKKFSGPMKNLSLKINKEIMANLDFVLDNRVVALRNLKLRSIFKIQEGIGRAFREYFEENGFTEIHSPKIVKAGAEGGTNMFEIDYFGDKAYLAQSPQFYKQFMVPVYGRVYEVGPVFRAEKHRTSRHINEYTGLDIEMGFIDSFKDIMKMEVGFLKHMINILHTQYAHEIKLLNIELPKILESGIPEVKFHDIKKIVSKKYSRPSRDGFDLEPEEEILIGKYIKEETGSDFVFVTHYPEKKRPFYTMLNKEDSNYTDSFDLLFKGLEITTGGQRIHDYNIQKQRMIEKGLNPEDFKEYLVLHQNGTPPHGGFGIGLERLTQKMIGFENIREATLFPRDIKRLIP